ncbi:uncharacterized protein LOC115242962 [Formica exsecta]|uniref:uncharacterized protein LOC115242962 n=1 Tax=Formica exsecta TaxID=72781 RepID=UPI0011422D93|nr:uncharacterized protein LOC115242962 [Formica exsecta]
MPTHDDRAVRNGGDDQVADTCFRFLVPTKERFPDSSHAKDRESKIGRNFPALGLPIVPRTHFRPHRTQRAPTNSAAAPPSSVRASEQASSRQGSVVKALGTSGTRHPSIVRSQDTRMDSNIVGFELTELCRASSSCKQFSRIQSQPGIVSQCGNT